MKRKSRKKQTQSLKPAKEETSITQLSVLVKKGEVCCALTEQRNFEPFFLPTDVACDLADHFGEEVAALPVTLAECLSLGECFNYDRTEVANVDDPDEPIWLKPSRHIACRSIEHLLHELQVTADRFARILNVLEKPTDAKSQQTSDAIGEDLKKDLQALVRILKRVHEYEIVEE